MRPTNGQQDYFFLWGMVFLPIVSLAAYIFDSYFYYYTTLKANSPTYEGLLSTILMIFWHLQYSVPIESKSWRFVYHGLLWTLIEVGHIGHLLAFIHKGKTFSIVIFVGWMILDVIFTMALLYCRIYRDLHPFIELDNKHIFQFISRLEFILAILIPVFTSKEYSTVTRHNIAFFLLLDFFSEKYERFNTVWIKSCLYLFVIFATVSLATEWLYFRFELHAYEYITEASELIAAGFSSTLIIMQFFQCHFTRCSSVDSTEPLQSMATDTKSMTMKF